MLFAAAWTSARRRSAGVAAWRVLAGRLAVIALSLLVLLLPAAARAEPLRLAISLTPLALPLFVAENRRFFAAEGVTVSISEVIGGHRTLQQVFDGTADVATSSDAVLMFNSFRRTDFSLIATFVTSDDDVRLVVRGGGIARIQDLAGKRVATVAASASHYFLVTNLLLAGVDPKQVQIRNLAPEAMVDALAAGEVDAIAIWEPYPFQALGKLSDARVLPKSKGYVENFNLLIANRLRGTRDDELVRLLRAIQRAQQVIAAEPEAAKAILRDKLKVGQEFIDYIWPRLNYRLTLSQSLLTTLEGEARWARSEGHVKGDRSPNYLDFIYSAPLRKAYPAAVGIEE